MSVLYIALPVALVIALIAIITFVTQVRNGQYDDLDTPQYRMLFDDEAKDKTNQAEESTRTDRSSQAED
ncbi:cbb3-type cytochrome oxidase assembly protein CcoS [Mariniblastus fucicola]|uniref:Cytochrome oxidase maturation protein cbb3-type n=1 Tax=Mariniblastus fucicola TaxID=980251 RepID=A0A5B9P2P8_9BACT|nr:cbb3-type cytochrome oxidase assembly protein CcoS [Mariniblastus fucicola]QEG20424.1 Cytochrome oxidase maturation protein cbb3-type [Mariniblastus fucicola]